MSWADNLTPGKFAVLIIAGAIGLWLLMVTIMLFVNYEKGMRMLGGISMFVHSVRKKPKPHPRRRKTDEQPVRKPRKTLAMTIRDFVIPPEYRDQEEKNDG